MIHLSFIPNWCIAPFSLFNSPKLGQPFSLMNVLSLKKIMLQIWTKWSDNLSLFNGVLRTLCSQRQQLCGMLMGSSPSQRHFDPFFSTHHDFFLHPQKLFLLFLSPLFICFFYTPLTWFLKWAWQSSHCLMKVCVHGRCAGRWDLRWDPLISWKPSPGRDTGQVSQSTPHTHWPGCGVRVKSVPSFMSQSVLLSPWSPGLHFLFFFWIAGASVGGNSCSTRGASWMHLLSSPSVLPFSFN